MRKFFLIVLVFVFSVFSFSCPGGDIGTEKPDDSKKNLHPRIILCFDDYSETWLDIVDRYPGCVFTFFFCVEINTPERKVLVNKLARAGHTIGNHSIDHDYLPHVAQENRDWFMQEKIVKLNQQLVENGATSVPVFAFPFGAFDRDWELRLLKVFDRIRRFGTTGNAPFFYSNELYKGSRIIASSSIDNVSFKTDTEFQQYVKDVVASLKGTPKTVVFTTHEINGGDWAITLDRLDFLIQQAKENGILFAGM